GTVGLNLTGDGQAVRLDAMAVSSNFFSLLGVKPAYGRGFQPDENTPGKTRVVILSHALWQSRFHGDPKVVGRTLMLDVGREVVGIMPRDFQFPAHTDAWVPY